MLYEVITLFGWLLFAVFITGSLGVFDEAISRWMGPPAQARNNFV